MSEDIYSTIVEHSPLINFVYDPGAEQFTYFNRSFRRLIGCDDGPVSGDAVWRLIPADERDYLRKFYWELLQGDQKENIELRMSVNNEERWLRLSASLMAPGSKKLIIGYAADITAENHNFNTLKKFANKKNSVLNILSHDLRGPLGIANTITQVIDKKIDDPHLLELTQTVSKIIRQSISLIKDLTSREFLETAEVELVKSRVNIALKFKEYIEELQRSQKNSKRTFKFSSSSEAVFINIDESKFFQVVNNLVTNALKFTHDDGGIIAVEVTESIDSILFTFSDNGIGIPEKFLPVLFEEFSGVGRIGLKGEPTTGTGLSVVKTILGWHNGSIRVQSKEGEGTTFYVEIPKG
ncbi:ATP-binding protein [Paradesertivirga mongoliensis]|uniref:histidine kinase n=1 Tax=Paradesertivirga mongoliensis TaxID=2100740 RepID=A0ABW4ZNF4_9SPHI|nr:PAS domain-containing sensor histidine kinase [Pedobacter mongoliensis]